MRYAHGLVKRGLGRRIRGGSAHAFYVGLAAEQESATARAICLIPRGHEEGQPVELTSQPVRVDARPAGAISLVLDHLGSD